MITSLTMIPAADDNRDPSWQQHAGYGAPVRELELSLQRRGANKRNRALRGRHGGIVAAALSGQHRSVRDKCDAIARSHEAAQVSLVLDALPRMNTTHDIIL